MISLLSKKNLLNFSQVSNKTFTRVKFLSNQFQPRTMVTANYTHGEPIRPDGASNDKSTTMDTELARIRKEYGDANFDETQIPESGHPIDLFKEWFEQALAMKMFEPNAMCLATCSPEGRPSNRMVLLKDYDKKGFVWYTNYESRKGQ